MGGTFTERLAIRASPEQRALVEDAAEREGLTPTELMREGVVLRARHAGGGILLAIEPDVTRRIRAAAEMEDVEPERWALRVLDGVAARRLGGDALEVTIGREIEEREVRSG